MGVHATALAASIAAASLIVRNAPTFAADAPKLPAIPTEPIAKKKELLFSDDFERAELGKDKGWAIVVPTYALENEGKRGQAT